MASEIAQIIKSVDKDLGDGFKVRRILPPFPLGMNWHAILIHLF